jgi:hypothetical protein
MVHSPKLQMSPHWPAVSAYTVTAQAHTLRLHMSPHMTTLWGCICRPTSLQFRGYTSAHMSRVWGYICHRTGSQSEVMNVTAQCLSQTLVISLHRPRFEVESVTSQDHGLRLHVSPHKATVWGNTSSDKATAWGYTCYSTEPRFEITHVTSQATAWAYSCHHTEPRF